MQKLNSFLTPLLIACLVLVTLDGAVPALPSFITFKRVGLVLLAILTVLVPNTRRGRQEPIGLALALAFVALWGCVASVAMNMASGVVLGDLFRWVFVAAFVFLFSRSSRYMVQMDHKRFRMLMIVAGSLFCIATLLYATYLIGPGAMARFDIFKFRRTMNDSLGGGLNRHLNGTFFWSIFPCAVTFGFIRCRGLLWFFATAGTLSFFLISILAGSRQTVAAICLFLPVLFFIRSRIESRASHGSAGRMKRASRSRLLIASVLSVAAIASVLSMDSVRKSLHRRYVQKTTATREKENSVLGRLSLMAFAWEKVMENPLFGVGGGFVEDKNNIFQKATHNGYLQIAANYGLPPLIVLTCVLWSKLSSTYRRRSLAVIHQRGEMWAICFSFLMVFLCWSMFFNDLMAEYMLYASVLIVCDCTAILTVRGGQHAGPLAMAAR